MTLFMLTFLACDSGKTADSGEDPDSPGTDTAVPTDSADPTDSASDDSGVDAPTEGLLQSGFETELTLPMGCTDTFMMALNADKSVGLQVRRWCHSRTSAPILLAPTTAVGHRH